ncbi:MAG: hypothetical protein CVU24_11760 [Betaproteobacteria bacterium HGW-Betaproteobacteria-18]|nr:MAG: hypothetical protein CVU24_11760 [Betaproteobacteria bacterium HGW-Betaproteobacteria-18]
MAGYKDLKTSARSAMIIFPLAALFNSFSMTALLLVFGIFGWFDIAADIGLVQGAMLGLFYAFSANARNLILADASGSAAIRLLQIRLLLMLPLAGAAYFLSVGIGAAAAPLAILLIVRRMVEWIGEIGLARHERMNQPSFAFQTLVGENFGFLFSLFLSLGAGVDLAFSAIPWALAPLLAIRRARLSWRGGREHLSFSDLLPHFGSTAIIGTSTYVFRISIALIVGKTLAGELFTAFAIGGMIPTVFGQALAPTLVHRFGTSGWPRWLLVIPGAMLLAAAALSAVVVAGPDWLLAIGRSSNFWLAIGLSIGGGAIMTIAAALRTRLIHRDDGHEVFGPDLLANVLIATCVPFVYYLFGAKALVALYLLSACLSFSFLWGAGRGRGISVTHRDKALLAIGALLVLPVFFQIGGGLFSDPAIVYDTGGAISRLPLPLSVLAMFAGIALLGNYSAAVMTMTALFFTALLFVTTALATSQNDAQSEGAKLILLAQFLLPMFGLILGEMFGSASAKPLFEKAALTVLIIVLPLQLAATWLEGATFAYPKVFVFSIYQHLQYFPMVVAALLTMVAMSLWPLAGGLRRCLVVLLPVSMVHLAASMSISAVAGALGGLLVVMGRHWRLGAARRLSLVVFASALCAGAGYAALTASGALSTLLNPQAAPLEEMSWRTKVEVADEGSASPLRVSGWLDYWRFYAAGVIESPRAFLLGHVMPTDRKFYPSARNYWLDAWYNFGAIALLPLIILLALTTRLIWQRRSSVFAEPVVLGTAIAAVYLLLGENMLKVGMRQPYPGIITFFIWGLLLARLSALAPDHAALSGATLTPGKGGA